MVSEERLEAIFGKENVVVGEDLSEFNRDRTEIQGSAFAAVLVKDEEMVKEAVKLSRMEGIPITPQGARTGYSGGAVPMGGIALSFIHMNRIVDVDERNLFAKVQPGMINAELKKKVKTLGLYYPPDPASFEESTIGGNVGEDASGPDSYRYGPTRNYVKGMRFVLMDGTAVSLGGKLYKNEMGYNVIGLMVGSEGTLSIFTEVTLKLLPEPEERHLIYSTFKTLEDASKAIVTLHSSYPRPTSMEIMDRNSIEAVEMYTGETIPAQATLFIGIDGTEEEVSRKRKHIKETLGRCGAVDIDEASESDMERLWRIRRELSPATKMLKPDKINEDISIPISTLPHFIGFMDSLSKKMGVLVVTFGHAGEGNLHVNIMLDRKNEDERKRANTFLMEMMKKVKDLGGSVTGEHGVGISKKEFLPMFLGKGELACMMTLKRAFDPQNLLNPGKIFP